ncbi:MAG: hypothetical protein QUV05_24010, partial [Phycisphaerae bacterium]|nr:hypothetical protein [Phycisphaerae bacterium]
MRSCMAMTSQGPPEPDCQNADLDHDGDVDGEDSARLNVCLAGSSVPVAPECFGPAASGSFTMHGLMVDVLADGKALLYARARHYDMKHGRWLQRDPLGFIDGPNLYEAFGG